MSQIISLVEPCMISSKNCVCFVDSDETCRMAKLAQYIEGLSGNGDTVEQSGFVSVRSSYP